MECEGIRGLLSAYLDGEVTEKERLLVEEHLASCQACRKELEELRRTVGLIAALPREAAPQGFASRVMARIPRPRLPARERMRKFFLRPQWAFVSGALATAALLFIAMGLFYWQGERGPSGAVLPTVAKVPSPPTPESRFIREEAEVAMMYRLPEALKVRELEKTEISEEVPSVSEVIALAAAFREDILAEEEVRGLRRAPVTRLSRWENEMAVREEEVRREKYKAQTLSNSLAYSFVQKEGVAGPQAQFIYLASQDLENARKELEDILAFTEKNGRRGRALVPIRMAAAAIRKKFIRAEAEPRGLAITVNLTATELDRILEQAIWADNFVTTGIEWPARPALPGRVGARVAFEPKAELEEAEDVDGDFAEDEAKRPLSQTVLILLEEER